THVADGLRHSGCAPLTPIGHRRTLAAPAIPAALGTAPSGGRLPGARGRGCCCRPACVRERTRALCLRPRGRRCARVSRCIAYTGSAVRRPVPGTGGRCRGRSQRIAEVPCGRTVPE